MSATNLLYNATAPRPPTPATDPPRALQPTGTDALWTQPPFESELHDAQRDLSRETTPRDATRNDADRTGSDHADRRESETNSVRDDSTKPTADESGNAANLSEDSLDRNDSENPNVENEDTATAQDQAETTADATVSLIPTPATESTSDAAGQASAAAGAAQAAAQPGKLSPANSTANPAETPAPSPVLEAAATTLNQANTGDHTDAGTPEDQPQTTTKTQAVNSNQSQASSTANVTPATADAAAQTPNPIEPNASSRTVGEAARPAAPSALTPQNGLSESDNINQARLARGLRTALNQQGGAVTLRLTPPEMGTVRIQMQLQGTAVTAQFHAESDAARSLLQQQLGQLRTALESQGLSVDRLGVQSMSNSNASAFNQGNDQQNAQQQTHDGRSRGQYQPQSQNQNGQGVDEPADEFTDLLTANAD